MLKIKGNNITLTRGDSAYITIVPTKKNEDGSTSPYVLQEGDKIRCQVRHEANDGELLFEAFIEEVRPQEYVWYIRPSDTNGAEVKTYFYDVQIELSNGDIFTFIKSSPFTLSDEVTEGY